MRLMGMNQEPEGSDLGTNTDPANSRHATHDPGTPGNPGTPGTPTASPLEADPPADHTPTTHFTDTGFDDLSDESATKSHTGMIVLCTIAALSGATLWGMHHLGTRGNVELVNISIDYPLDSNSTSADYTDIITDLQGSTQLVQVPPDRIQMNPFSWKATSETAVAGTGGKTAQQLEAERAQREHERFLASLDATVASFKVGSVMGGRVPMAQISGQLVRVGDTLAEHFTVEKIEGRAITLTAEGRTWTIGVD